jgi:hypothetical protein
MARAAIRGIELGKERLENRDVEFFMVVSVGEFVGKQLAQFPLEQQAFLPRQRQQLHGPKKTPDCARQAGV